MFGKRSNSWADRPKPALQRAPAPPRVAALVARRLRARSMSRRRLRETPTEQRSEEVFPNQIDDFRRVDRGDRPGGAFQIGPGERTRGNPRHRPRNRHDKESRSFDLGAGKICFDDIYQLTFWAWVRWSRCSPETISPTSWSTGRPAASSKSGAKFSSPTFDSATLRS